MTRPAIAVIGAGVAGLAFARTLQGQAAVTVFDKARGPGGRLASRASLGFDFDFGAQFFTARDPRFMAEIDRLRAAGIVQPWQCRFAEIEAGQVCARRLWSDEPAHFVTTERMNSLARHWAEGLDVHLSTRISALTRGTGGWWLTSEQGERFGPFAFVVLALPAPQAAALLPASSSLRPRAEAALMQGCYALMLGFAAPLDPGFDAALVRDGVLSWIAVCQSRPGHTCGPGLVALSRNSWADQHMEAAPEAVQAMMMSSLREIIPALPLAPAHADLHRWRYANCPPVPPAAPLVAPDEGLALCGDWTSHGRVEAAYLSGLETASMLAAPVG